MPQNIARLYPEFGQSAWLDNIQRKQIESGELARIRDRGVRGLTSNPAIFQKAIQGSADTTPNSQTSYEPVARSKMHIGKWFCATLKVP